MNGKKLTTVECAKYLGVLNDSKLSFNQHIDNVAMQKANSVLGFARRNFKSCFCKRNPVLEYAAAVWTPHIRCFINKLGSVQRRAAHFTMNNYCQSSSVFSFADFCS